MAATSQQTMLNQALFEQNEQQEVASLSTTQMMSGAINCNISTLNPNLITAFPLLGGNYQSLFKGFMPSPLPPPQPSVEAPPLPPHNNLAAETFLLLSSKQREEENNDINVNQDYILAGSNLLSLQRSGANLWAWGDHQGNHSERSNTRRNMNDEINCNNNNNNNNHHHHHHLHHHRQVLGVGTMKMKKIIKGRKKVREPRFCFKTPSEVDVLDDGYKWRKYGQKVVNNTQHPRSYYRCTQDNCRVKKRVERLAEDPRMVLTTYEGRHVHSPSHDLEDTQSQSQLNNFFF